jgi:hypothetical protein
MQQDAEHVFAMLNAIRDSQRQRMRQQAAEAGGGFTYERGEVDGPAQPVMGEASGPRGEGAGAQGPPEGQTPAVLGQ